MPPQTFQYDLRTGYPNLRVVPHSTLIALATDVIQSQRGLQYTGDLYGSLNTRRQVASFLSTASHQSIAPNELAITNGAIPGIDTICRAFTKPGDIVIVEDPTFYYILNVIKRSDVEVMGIPLDDEGINLAALEKLLEKYGDRIRIVYTIPSYHNPTGMCATESAREGLVHLAQKYNFMIIEDSTYQILYFDTPPPPFIQTFDDIHEHVLTVGSVSKIIMPALRVGWIWGSRENIRKCIRYKSDASTSLLNSEIVADFIESGAIYSQIEYARTFYGHKHDVLVEALQDCLPDSVEWSIPNGGYFIWLELPGEISASKLLDCTQAQGMDFLPGTSTFVGAAPDRYIRLCFAMMDDETLIASAQILGDSLLKLAN